MLTQRRSTRPAGIGSGPAVRAHWRDVIGVFVSRLTSEKVLADAVATAGHEAAMARQLAQVEDSADGSEQIDPRWSGRP